jgi:alkaline phosphatase
MLRSALATSLALLLIVASPARAQLAPETLGQDETPTNVILLIPDGFGPASVTMARDYLRWRDGTTELAYDSLHVGSSRTFSSSSRITDSAAGGTALATGEKTYNGAISVDTSKQAVATLLEGAERNGMATGLVATSRITHATPAVFSAHVPDRGQENRIARQQLNQDIEVMLGGGRRHFVPQSAEGSDREDDRNLLATARDRGYSIVETADELAQAGDGRLLGLFSDSHMAYEIDRESTNQPSLDTMTEAAIDRLSTDEDGYFLMVEGSRIDHAGHGNDAAAHLHDILAFNDAVETALSTAKADENTLVLVVSDHETGGLTLGRNRDGEGIYAWHPDVLSDVTASSSVIADSIRSIRSSDADEEAKEQQVAGAIAHFTGISDVEDDLIEDLLEVEGPYAVSNTVSTAVNRNALVGWTSHAHTGVDVSLYGYGPGAYQFIGNHDNTEIGRLLADLLDTNLRGLTTEMRSESPATGR